MIEVMEGFESKGRYIYWIRDWSKYDPATGTIPEWKEHSYDMNDPTLVAIREEIDARKGEFKTAMEWMIRAEG